MGATPVVVNGVKVWPCALVDASWLAEHPEYTAALREAAAMVDERRTPLS